MPADTLILFDIDGTLLSASRVPARILGEVLTEVFGTQGSITSFDYSGKTDPQIVRELMRGAGVAEERIAKALPEALSRYVEQLDARLAPEHVKAKPGVESLLERLAADPRVTLGLLTGNLEPGARIKLRPLDLDRYFPFGAYGSDSEDRYTLPSLAVARAHACTGVRFEGKRVVIVGDSVHDVLCGRSIGVKAVAVATGPTPRDRLLACGPDALLDDFSDTEAALTALLDGIGA
ncbi:MAG TPA: HAD family hydrolase [Vicinamibacteria bacterium]|nr:HAD family hydrolase [Vicinamibacteria bacterium]